ncbi:MAG: hypothetical protein SynsKO_41010 [Synoicihabitans sp.]
MRIPKITAVVFALCLATVAVAGSLDADGVPQVSMMRLLGSPEEFHGKRIRVIGFVHLEFEGDGIYLHREDFNQRIYKNGLWISALPEVREKLQSLNDRYVFVEGIFRTDQKGHMGLWSGSIMDVSIAFEWPPKR